MILKSNIHGQIIQFTGGVFQILVSLFLANYLTVDEFGEFNLLLGLINVLSIISIHGMNVVMPLENQEKKFHQEVLGNILLISSILSFFLCVLLFYKGVELQYIILIFFISILFTLIELERIHYSLRKKAWKGILLKLIIVNLVFISSLLFLNKFVVEYSVIYAFFIGHIVTYLPFFKKKIRFSKAIFFAGLPYLLIQLLYNLPIHSLKILPTLFFDFETIAAISVGVSLSRGFAMIGNSSSFIAMPFFRESIKANKSKELRLNYDTIRSINSLIGILGFNVLIWFFNDILNLLDPIYLKYKLTISILIIGSLIPIILGPSGSIILMFEGKKQEISGGLIFTLVYALIVLIIGYKEPHYFAIAYVIGETSSALYKNLWATKMIKLERPNKQLILRALIFLFLAFTLLYDMMVKFLFIHKIYFCLFSSLVITIILIRFGTRKTIFNLNKVQ